MKTNILLKQLQRATLQSQGLTKTQTFGKGKNAVLKAIEQLGYIQIDTISVIERAHHHTLQTRVPDYHNNYLHQLVEERKVFEYWFHAASYLPMQDFRFALPRMLSVKSGEIKYYNKADTKSLEYVYDRIRLDGPKKARDFENSHQKGGTWWDWKPAKVALEKLFMQGDLMVTGRNGMEKVYDLTERVIPNTINTTEPTPMEFAEHLVNTNLKAYGFTTIKQITHLRKGTTLRKNVQVVLQKMLEEKSIQKIEIENFPTLYIQANLLQNTIKKPANIVRLLSPFDNTIIHRDRIEQLFDFDYKIECYVPKPKRQYGYFCLPILYGEQFIGRVDCKAHRKEKLFEIIHLHIEDITQDVEQFLVPFTKTIQQFAIFNGCESIKVSRVSPSELLGIFKGVLKA